MKQKNLSFTSIDKDFKNYWKLENRTHHGGLYSVGKRKTRRPLSTKKPLHVVMRSDIAAGAMSLRLPKNKFHITQLVEKHSKGFQIRIYKYSINSNHIHFVLRAKNRSSFQGFLRALSGIIARLCLRQSEGLLRGDFGVCSHTQEFLNGDAHLMRSRAMSFKTF